MTADDVIGMLELEPLHGEGGYFRETYRSAESVPGDALPARYRSARTMSTGIYYLVTPESFSHLHRVRSDELFHFYLGDPVTLLRLYPRGAGDVVVMGSDISAGERLQCAVPHGVWTGLSLADGGQWALLGTTVSPGFEFEDFELAARDSLLASHPSFGEYIVRLTE